MVLFSLLFPKLCYGCQAPGAYFCSNCLEKLLVEDREGRCLHCFRYLGSSETRLCSQCSPSSQLQAFSLYLPSQTALSVYARACEGKRPALQFFSKSIAFELASLDETPSCIAYITSTISREIVVEVAKLEKLLRIPLWPWLPKKRQIEKLPKGECICFLSAYPLSQKWMQAIVGGSASPVVSISLFLSQNDQ
ncbi:conserved hypothetical protein [Chlamydia pneumoniae LPCoLN]|uniref:hypothetical protein n=1 Tax=Chlamydia pneumoniae TaxID=83558 RepID=UPI0001BD9BC2|nr:hypothetical protein [Chlamydia pneumoniae]ACZ33404.1 conserved hypothetical protein [Chlamydia pneumoniae LPCoLN]